MENKKTIREHLNDLPEPYRTEALENLTESIDGRFDIPNSEDKADALQGAFVWASTPQGFEYWEKFYETL